MGPCSSMPIAATTDTTPGSQCGIFIRSPSVPPLVAAECRLLQEATMAKVYWVATYRAIHDPAAFAAYAKLAGPALEAGGGRFLARGNPAQVYDNAVGGRVVLIEFASVAQARAAHD